MGLINTVLHLEQETSTGLMEISLETEYYIILKELKSNDKYIK